MLLPRRKVIKIGAHYSCRSIWAIAQLKEVESWDQIRAARLHPSHGKFLHPCPASIHSRTFPSIVNSFPAPIYFYHFPYLVPWRAPSLCPHPSASDAYLCPAFGPVAVGSADLRCWPKPCVCFLAAPHVCTCACRLAFMCAVGRLPVALWHGCWCLLSLEFTHGFCLFATWNFLSFFFFVRSCMFTP